MATAKKKRNKESGSNDSVIASRILQDIINNSSETFRRFLEQQGVGAMAAAPQPQDAMAFTPPIPQPPVGMPPMAPQQPQGFGGQQQDPQALQLMQLLGLA